MPLENASLARFGYSILKDASRLLWKYVKADPQFMTDALAKHLVRAEAWSGSMSMLGMSKPADIDKQSIAIAISSQPRKFHSIRDPDSGINEDVIVNSTRSMILLGDPGAGKTTAIKRALRRLILESQEESAVHFEYPLLIFGRDISASSDLFDQLFHGIGFTIAPPPRVTADQREFDEWRRNQPAHMKEAVTTALFNAPVMVFIDGVDEIDPALRSAFERDVEYLNETMSKGKVVATCRSGDWNRPLSNFEVYEISSLSGEQIEAISNMWAQDPTAFLQAISSIPYKEMLDRPLLLTLLIIIYNQTGRLPDQPVDVYQRFVSLLISEWDEQRDLKRPSRFADFQSGRKHKFLSDAAYQLMIRLGTTRFTRADLSRALQDTAARFGQSPEEIQAIIGELEGHTGILVESGFGNYEFCHLTVQEYLAAGYLVGLPGSGRNLELIVKRSPATLAVAVSLSSDPTQFLADSLIELLGGRMDVLRHPAESRFLKSFLARLRLERPTLTESYPLGLAALLIVHTFDAGSILKRSVPEYQSMWDEIMPFLDQSPVRDSLDLMKEVMDIEESASDAEELVLSIAAQDDWIPRIYNPSSKFGFSSDILTSLAEMGICSWLTDRRRL